MKTLLTILVLSFVLFPIKVYAHCEIPCGIFDDSATFAKMMENAQTIKKSMVEINKLSAQETIDHHGITRWTMNKEDHAIKIQETVSRYFLAQRVKLPADNADEAALADYTKHTTLLHEIIVTAMKTKQTLDTSAVDRLRDAITAYKEHYYKDHEGDHAH
ncbi:MAG: superoxide dismutase [Ni] [Pseudomonadota bacterium]